MSHPQDKAVCRPENLTLYHYGELEEPVRRQLEEHLENCDACRRELASLDATLDRLPNLISEPSPDQVRTFNRRLLEKTEPRRTRRLNPAWGWSFAVAAAVLLLLIIGPLQFGPHPPPAEVAVHGGGQVQAMPDADLLLNMDLLQNLDLLQQLDGTGMQG